MRSGSRTARYVALLVVSVLGAQFSGIVGVGAESSPRGPQQQLPCASRALVAIGLDASRAASLEVSPGTRLGAAGAAAVATSEEGALGDICTAPVPAHALAEATIIESVARVSPTRARSELLAWAKDPTGALSPRLARPHRSLAHTTGPCPAVDPTIKLSSATSVEGDLEALRIAQLIGADDASTTSTLEGDLQSSLAGWVTQAAPTTVGDWIGVAETAQLLGDDALATSALSHAAAAAAQALEKAKPADPCHASASELDCYERAAAVAELLDAPGVTSPASLLANCAERWQIDATLTGGTGGSNSTIHYSTGEFVVAASGAVTPPAGSGSGWPATFSGAFSTGTCPGQLHANPARFNYTVSGNRVAQGFELTMNAPGLNISLQKSGSSVCIDLAYGIVKMLLPIFQHWPLLVTVPAGARSVTSTSSTGGMNLVVHLKQVAG